MQFKIFLCAMVLLLVLSPISGCSDREEELEQMRIFRNVNKRLLVGKQVTIEHGVVIGKKNKTAAGTVYLAFQGIPYAKPPVGDLRFEPPVPPEKWTVPWNATYERSKCYQVVVLSSAQQEGKEDCLYLNVYTPKINKPLSKPLPVMFWVHGGGFILGSGNYNGSGPDYFLDKGIVVVTTNYRLGVFGWLSTGDKVVPGNMGLKDLVQGLKWVRTNIAAFGGNPNHVTIMGESGGAACVSYLVHSSLAKGLFHGAIIQSGNTLSPWSLNRNTARENVLLLAKLYGVWTENSTQIIHTLKNATSDDLHSKAVLTMALLLIRDPLNGFVYAPVQEIINPTIAFTGMSYEQLYRCNVSDVPLLIGFNSAELDSNEGVAELVKVFAGITTIFPATLVPKDMHVEKKSSANVVGPIIKNHYTNGSLLVTNKNFLRYLGDDFFVRPTAKYVQLFSRCNKTYFFRFSYNGGQNKRGAGHGEQLKYLFSTGVLNSEADRTVSKYSVGLWSNFIKFWNPTPTFSEFHITWDASNRSNGFSYLDLNEELRNVKFSDSPHYYSVNFWFNLYNRYGTRPYDTY